MLGSAIQHESSKNGWRLLFWILGLTALIEAVTCVMRFGLQLESTRDTASLLSWFTFGYRIHHGYIGLLLTIAALIARRGLTSAKRGAIAKHAPSSRQQKNSKHQSNGAGRSTEVTSNARWTDVALVVGLALLASDVIHHFLVLWPVTGSPQFDFVYPPAD
ncbi:MAG TPA: hypothetical protein DDW52_25020 [Planctomycetaceae bacterium]|nr:hypothetical protein [Planctomycetaceae bacterium]